MVGSGAGRWAGGSWSTPSLPDPLAGVIPEYGDTGDPPEGGGARSARWRRSWRWGCWICCVVEEGGGGVSEGHVPGLPAAGPPSPCTSAQGCHLHWEWRNEEEGKREVVKKMSTWKNWFSLVACGPINRLMSKNSFSHTVLEPFSGKRLAVSVCNLKGFFLPKNRLCHSGKEKRYWLLSYYKIGML